MNTRNIKNGTYGWFEKGALKKIETLPFRQQASCKLIYFALCSLSAREMDSKEIKCYRYEIIKYSSLSDRTIRRYLPLLENINIIKAIPQARTTDGRYEKVSIVLLSNTSPLATSSALVGQMLDTVADIDKERIKKETNKYLIEKDFEIIWSSYKNKSGDKKLTLKKFIKAKHKKELLPIILEAIKLQEANPKFEGYNMPMSSTWINAERWNDEVIIKKKSNENEYDQLKKIHNPKQ